LIYGVWVDGASVALIGLYLLAFLSLLSLGLWARVKVRDQQPGG
jgi:hypothetical protein